MGGAEFIADAPRLFLDGIHYERFSLQIQEQKDLGYRNALDNVNKVRSVVMQQVLRDAHFETVVVCRSRASAAGFTTSSLETNARIGGLNAQPRRNSRNTGPSSGGAPR